MPTLDWDMRQFLPQLQSEGRLNVLIAMILRANGRLRCYPALETLVDDTGLSIATVNRAKNWLRGCGFFTLVPYRKRVDEEVALNRRHNVYQLTGVCIIDNVEHVYLHLSPEATAENLAVVRKTLLAKVLPVKTLVVKAEGISSSEGISNEDIAATPDVVLKHVKEYLVPVFNAVAKHIFKTSDCSNLNDGDVKRYRAMANIAWSKAGGKNTPTDEIARLIGCYAKSCIDNGYTPPQAQLKFSSGFDAYIQNNKPRPAAPTDYVPAAFDPMPAALVIPAYEVKEHAHD